MKTTIGYILRFLLIAAIVAGVVLLVVSVVRYAKDYNTEDEKNTEKTEQQTVTTQDATITDESASTTSSDSANSTGESASDGDLQDVGSLPKAGSSNLLISILIAASGLVYVFKDSLRISFQKNTL